ncbi:HAD family hydrolase [Pseudooceanicola algae]|uniref:Uncharacterized protein n=1 Tax=Pseudooceanicola algae TaxID=1537215 RepID=A0A418SC30_9RHOB|nr:HAD family hydrolase [Pseudooceanicola algae]QPM89942.1 hypothetical protein PSAL_011720 [Pseudooceanicola algae]
MTKTLTSVAALFVLAGAAGAQTLPSWNDSASRDAIISFVDAVTEEGGQNFVPEADRIAVFDNDGTLWTEQPVYFQAIYALDQVKARGAEDPSLLTSDVLKAAAAGDLETVLASGMDGVLEVINFSHSNVTVADFKASAHDWMTSATHPQSGMAYAEMTYQPMVELLEYLREEGFATYIVSGGGIDFIRAISQDAYGIPPQQVVGSEGTTHYEVIDGTPTLMKDGGLSFNDDKDGKPVGIERFIGKRPIFAAGNSDGDFQMLEWTSAGEGPSLGMLVHHTDDTREYAYDREGHIGVLNMGLDEAEARGWVIVDMAQDWSAIWTGQD